jgi:dUTP pyrophosphatase
MKIRIKKLHPQAKIPSYARPGDAAVDLTAVSRESDYDLTACTSILTYKTGLAIEIPENHVGLLFPRSSISSKNLILTNCVGVIDSGYRGEIMFKFRSTAGEASNIYSPQDRIGQLIILPYPKVEFEEVEELSETERGTGGFGSSGK